MVERVKPMDKPVIRKFYPRFSPILPLVYDDMLSYYEQLCKLVQKINEVIDRMNSFEMDLESLVDEKIAPVYEYIDRENAKQDEHLAEEIARLEAELDARITNLFEYVDNLHNYQQAHFTNEIRKLKDYIDQAIMGKIMVFNPTKGYKTPLDECINDLYDSLRYWGITALGFDSLELTASEYEGRSITAKRFDLYALEILGKYYRHYIFDPVNGLYDTLQRVLYRFFQYVRPDALTATNFDGDTQNATALDALEFTAVGFDTNGITVTP